MEQFRLRPASTEEIRRQSSGEVTRPEVLDRQNRPMPRGVCCESIFGREDEWACSCGRLRGTGDVGYICVRCDGPVVHLRGTRWGHVELTSPVVNPLFVPTLAAVLDYTPAAMRQIARAQAFAVLEPGSSGFSVGDLIHQDFYFRQDEYGDEFEVGTGADAVRALLSRVDLPSLRDRLALDPAQRRRFRVVDRLCRAAPDDPNGHVGRMLLDCIPVLPPALRLPRGQGGDAFGESLSTMYARIVERNNRLRKLLELSAPEVIVLNEKRMLQACVEMLFGNEGRGRHQGRAWRDSKVRSLADRLRGPTRDRLLSRRVDYSASGVLVPDASLPADAVAIPIGVAVEQFRPHLLTLLPDGDRATQLLDLLHPRPRGGLDASYLAVLRLHRETLDSLGERLVPLVEEVLSEHRLVLSVHADRPGPLVALRPVLGRHPVIAIHGDTMTRLGATPGMRARLHLPLSEHARGRRGRCSGSSGCRDGGPTGGARSRPVERTRPVAFSRPGWLDGRRGRAAGTPTGGGRRRGGRNTGKDCSPHCWKVIRCRRWRSTRRGGRRSRRTASWRGGCVGWSCRRTSDGEREQIVAW